MQNIALSFVETFILLALSTVLASFFAGLGGLIRYCTHISGRPKVGWLIRLGLFVGTPFAVMGMASGYLTGSSRVGAISALVPAGLTLVGGVAVYLFGKGGKAGVMAGFAVINFSSTMMIGTIIGGREREETEEYKNSIDYQYREVEKEFQIDLYRRSLGIDSREKKKPSETDIRNHE